MRVLILEDEESIRGFVTINLKRHGMEVMEASDGETALDIVTQHKNIDIALLDVMLPTISGLQVCQELRREFPRMGIIMLTAKSQDEDKVRGLELGADDYITKPFSPTELIARINALYRRMLPDTDTDLKHTIVSGPFVLSLTERKLFKLGMEIDLTPTEFAIVQWFMEHPNQGISRDDILNAVWGRFYIGDLKIVDVNVRRIRQKIEDDPSTPRYIETIWGYGYSWKKEDSLEQH